MFCTKHIISIGPLPLLLIAIAVFLLVIHSLRHRDDPAHPTDDLACPRCKSIHPSHANYCSRCGHQLR
ncbi:MAG: hypothetical protein NTU53_07700 [Planctomycetota bacterium]|nr:hypothetical protein [Planctomycetota bacterium]